MTNADYKAFRIALGYTQDELALKLGVARKTISTRENGNDPIREEARLAILSISPKQNK